MIKYLSMETRKEKYFDYRNEIYSSTNINGLRSIMLKKREDEVKENKKLISKVNFLSKFKKDNKTIYDRYLKKRNLKIFGIVILGLIIAAIIIVSIVLIVNSLN